MNIVKFLFVLGVSVLALSSFILASDNEEDYNLDFAINGCQDSYAYTLLFNGFRHYGKVTSRIEEAAFVVGMSEIKKSPRIVARIRKSGKKQSLILRIDKNTYKDLELISSNDYLLKASIRYIFDEFKAKTNWRLFYVLLPYGASEDIIKAFNDFKISVVSTAVKVPSKIGEADTSELEGVVIFDTESYDFGQKHLEEISADAVSLGECIPRGSAALEVEDTEDLSSFAPKDLFSVLIKGGLKHYDVVKVLDLDSAFVVTLNDLSNYETLIRSDILDKREIIIYLSKNDLDSERNASTVLNSILTSSNRFNNRLKRVIIAEDVETRVRQCFMRQFNNHYSYKVIDEIKQFTVSDAAKENAGRPFNFKGFVFVDLENSNPDDSGKSKDEKNLAEKDYLFNMLQAVKSKMQNQELSPVPFSQSSLAEESKRSLFHSRFPIGHSGNNNIEIGRETFFEDTVRIFRGFSNENLRTRLFKIRFTGEEGIDSGGLNREWYSMNIRHIFEPETGIFVSEPGKNTFHLVLDSDVSKNRLEYFTFAGRFIAKTLIDKAPIGRHLSLVLCKLILGHAPTLFDLKEIDDDNSFKSLLQIATSTDSNYLGAIEFVSSDGTPLRTPVVGKADEEEFVTIETKFEYVSLYAKYKMITSRKPQIDAFLDGFHQVISKDRLSSFTPDELRRFISGPVEIDIEKWQRVTSYDYGEYSADSDQVKWFWRFIREIKRKGKADKRGKEKDSTLKKILRFATGFPNVPNDFKIHRSCNGPEHLPEAHTCFNQLDIPAYPSYQVLRKKLVTAANLGAEGFALA